MCILAHQVIFIFINNDSYIAEISTDNYSPDQVLWTRKFLERFAPESQIIMFIRNILMIVRKEILHMVSHMCTMHLLLNMIKCDKYVNVINM